MFIETVKGRYARIMGLVHARKKSIDEYRNMLKPYIMRYRSIKELGSTPQGRNVLQQLSWMYTKGQAMSFELSTIWAFKHLTPGDLFKAPTQTLSEKSINVLALPFPQKFKERIKRDMEAVKAAGVDKTMTHPSGIEPLDKWALVFLKYIEEEYKIKLSTVEILQARDTFVDLCSKKGWTSPYFSVVEIKPGRSVIRMPDGAELEDLMLDKVSLYMDTINVMLARFFEIKAQEKEMENYIGEMLGEVAIGEMEGKVVTSIKSIDDIASGEFPRVFGAEVPEKKGKGMETDKAVKNTMKKIGLNISFIKPGPYETTFEDRITGLYFTEMGSSVWNPVISFLKGEFKVPGWRAKGRQ